MKTIVFSILSYCAALLVLCTSLHASGQAHIRLRYVKNVLAKNGFSQSEIETIFSDSRLEKIAYKKAKGKKINWAKFTADLLKKESVADGRRFLEKNDFAFRHAESMLGVPREHLAAIIRIETNFGNFLGSHSVFNVFYTNLLNNPETKKWRWAAQNLISLVKYCRQTNKDCFSLKGSYAGALGLPQFLPYSLERFGYDGNEDGLVDLFEPSDAIASAANFLKAHGWSDNPAKKKTALAKYYGSPRGYPKAALLFAAALTPNAAEGRNK